jgi:hypothetical protein
LPEVAAHVDRALASEQVVPTDTVTVAMDEVVPEDGSPVLEAVLEVISLRNP